MIKKNLGSIDYFDDKTLTIVDENNSIFHINRNIIMNPDKIVEGAIIYICPSGIYVDVEETNKIKQEVFKKQTKLFKRSKK